MTSPVVHRARRLSGLQKDVLHLYREFLRTIQTKSAEQQPALKAYVRKQFDAQLDIKGTHVSAEGAGEIDICTVSIYHSVRMAAAIRV